MANTIKDVTIRAKIEIANAAQARDALRRVTDSSKQYEKTNNALKRITSQLKLNNDISGAALNQQKKLEAMLRRELLLLQKITFQNKAAGQAAKKRSTPPPLPKGPPPLPTKRPGAFSQLAGGLGLVKGGLAGSAVPVAIMAITGTVVEALSKNANFIREKGRKPDLEEKAANFATSIPIIGAFGAGIKKKLEGIDQAKADLKSGKVTRDLAIKNNQAIIQGLQKQRQLILEVNRERIKSAQLQLEESKQAVANFRRRLNMEKERQKQSAGQFGMLGPEKQAGLIQALERFQRGGFRAVGDDGLQLLQGNRITADILRERAEKNGAASPLFKKILDAKRESGGSSSSRVKFLQRQIKTAELSVKLSQANLDKLTVKIEDVDVLIKKFSDKLLPMLQKDVESKLQSALLRMNFKIEGREIQKTGAWGFPL